MCEESVFHDPEFYHRLATDPQLAASSRKAAANSYIDSGGCVDIDTERDTILLYAAISKISLREIAEWLIKKAETLDESIYGIVAKRLAKSVDEGDDLISEEKKRILQKCIKQCFRGILMNRSGADLKILRSLLKLQRKLDITADQQFVWLCSLPNAFKEKWPLLASLIPALKRNEIFDNDENTLMSILWRAQTRHSSGSATSDCLLAWFISERADHKNCAWFLANCLVSSNRMRRLNCSRFWLAKLNTNAKSKLIMKEVVAIIVQMISEENRFLKQATYDCCLTKEELYHLTCADRSWISQKEELCWTCYDCLLFGWISIQKFFIRELETNEIDLLRECLISYHSSVRLEALKLLNKLIDKKLLDWSRHFGSIKFFVLRNLDSNDSNLRAAVLDFVRIADAKARKRLEVALLEELDNIQIDWDKSYQAAFIVELLKQCGFDKWLFEKQQLNAVFNSNINEIRTKLLMSLPPTQSASQDFLLDKFREMLSNDSIDGLSDLVQIISQFKEPKEILDLMKTSNCKKSNSVKVTLLTLMQNFGVESLFDPIFWADVCIKSNNDLILLSGSERIGLCTSLPELYRRLSSSVFPTLMISDKQRKAVDHYYRTLKVNCEMLASLCETAGTKSIIAGAYDSIWNVLMRSRHKGVVDDCAICFSRITTCCIANDLLDVVRQYFEKTKGLFMDTQCTTRNLAFCTLFRTFHETLGASNVIDFLLGNICLYTSVVAVRLMKVLKTFLYMASFDFSYFAVKIFKLVLDLYRTGNSMVRNAACHCFAALVHRLVDDTEYGIPLFMFILRYDLFWTEYCQQLKDTTLNDPALILLLSLLEKLRFVSSLFYTMNQLRYLQSLINKLLLLLVSCPNLRINRLLVSSLLHLVPYKRKLTSQLKRILEHKLPFNIRNALTFAVAELESTEFLDLPSDSVYPFPTHCAALLPVLIQKTHKTLLASNFICFEQFGTLLAEIEKYAHSTNESWRLHAVYALLMLSRSSCSVLIHFYSYRYRFIYCCRLLLSDEVDLIRRVAFNVAASCGTMTTLQYSWNPAVKLNLGNFQRKSV
uniref:Uncharacterized protein n=1 Tax=Setaria digitata TaxID=48799 RepID=A0A915PYU0_9BILA